MISSSLSSVTGLGMASIISSTTPTCALRTAPVKVSTAVEISSSVLFALFKTAFASSMASNKTSATVGYSVSMVS